MLKSRSGGSSSSSGNIFNGVRFVLFGFDSVSEAQYRSEIERRGGTDVGKYDDSCTHVIVSGRVYASLRVDDIFVNFKDDPVCIAARRDGKPVVMELWVDDSVDFGMLADANRKYELAKKVKIKLVNHRWLVDCLKAWEILPIDNYTKSGWELEVLEAEARDSEEETEDPGTTLLGQRSTTGASHLRGEMPFAACSHVYTSSRGISSIHQETPAAKPSLTADSLITNQKLVSTPCNETNVSDALCEENLNNNVGIVHQEAESTSQTISDRNREAVKVGGSSIPPDALNPKVGSPSSRSDPRCSTLSYSKITTKKEVMTSNLSREGLKENISNGDVDISLDDAGTDCESDHCQNLTVSSVLPQKRKDSDLSPSKSPKLECQESKFSSHSPSRNIGFAQLEPTSASLVNHGHVNASNPFEGVAKTSSKDNQHAAPSKFKSLSFRRSFKRGQLTQSKFLKSADSPSIGSAHDAHPREALDQPRGVKNKLPVSEAKDSGAILSPSGDMVLGGKPSDDEAKRAMDVDGSVEKCGSDSMVIDDRNKEMKTHKKVSKPEMVSNSENGGDTVMKDLSKFIADETGKLQRREQNEEAASPPSRDSETKKFSSSARTSACKETVNNKSSALRIKKVVSRRNLSCKSTVNISKDKGVNSSDKSATPKIMPGNIEKLKAKMDVKKASSEDERKETAESASKDVIMEDDKVKPKGRPLSATSSKKKALDRMKASVDPEKENKPKENGISSVNANSHPNRQFGRDGSKKNSWQVAKKFGMKSNGDQTSRRARLVNPEPVWFILSGHRFQRKEFQSVIRRLRGRVCRDSHNWSYQATHFIVPDPVRRTEKFFAAAAAGRWILKTDYLTASNEAGKFLDEEPFEWYKKGLTEDGAISLEAPRKWRHLRERTGHGAFHKMRIIIYGECIAPTLDSLKRVVKAGDGSILATSPPYTRFFKTGIDFAIVSVSMPRVDSWVQEFLRHEIPCVVADYLVEYVCKPGYPLDRHVLYNTNSLAEKSFANLLSRLEEIVEESNNDDIKCSVCGSRDRGEVMLICEDENGSAGCGIGTHIDCCNPPMDAVPEGDWFCPKCNQDSAQMTPLTTTKKKSSAKLK